MEFRPCIDLHEGVVKQIVGSSLSDDDNSADVNFSSTHSAGYYAELYREKNITGGHVIKLGPGNDTAAREALQSYPMGLQIGGGITADNAQEWLDTGASHVIVTSYVFRDGALQWGNLNKLVSKIGKERLVLDLSCKKVGSEYVIVTDRWQKLTEMTLSQETFENLSSYCDEFLIHAASVEGKQAGPDVELVEKLAQWCTIPVTYAGGVTTLDDLEAVRRAGQNRVHVTIGSALDLFGGNLSFEEAVSYCQA